MPPWVEGEDSIEISDCFPTLSATESIPWLPLPRLDTWVPTQVRGLQLSRVTRSSTTRGGVRVDPGGCTMDRSTTSVDEEEASSRTSTVSLDYPKVDHSL